MNIRIIYIARSSRLAWLAPILIVGLMLAGCGKKTFPKPDTEEMEAPPQVRDLQTEVQSKGVELSWTVPARMKPGAGGGSGHVFAVLRADLMWDNRNCENCPSPIRSEIVRIDPAFPTPAYFRGDRLVWIDPNVSQKHAYRYTVAVKDRSGRAISHSNPFTARVVAPPVIPTELTASPSQQGILLQWKAVTKDEQGQKLPADAEYLVERHAPNEPWQRITKIPVKGTTYLDSVIAADQTYNYRVVPELLFEGTSVVGEPAVIFQINAPDALPPPPPKSVWIIPAKGALEIHWTPADGKVGGYHVYRKEGKEIIRLTASPIQAGPFSDRAVKRNQTYYYAVSAVSIQPDHREGLLSKWTEIRNVLFEQ
jgi:hypothetical protein